MVDDIRFHKVLAQNLPYVVFGVLPEPSSPMSAYAQEMKAGGVEPGMYIGGSYMTSREDIRKPNVSKALHDISIENMKLIHGQAGTNALIHEGIHDTLNRMGEIEASKMLDLTSPSIDELESTGLSNEAAMKNALEYAKLRESGQRIRKIMRRGGY